MSICCWNCKIFESLTFLLLRNALFFNCPFVMRNFRYMFLFHNLVFFFGSSWIYFALMYFNVLPKNPLKFKAFRFFNLLFALVLDQSVWRGNEIHALKNWTRNVTRIGRYIQFCIANICLIKGKSGWYVDRTGRMYLFLVQVTCAKYTGKRFYGVHKDAF